MATCPNCYSKIAARVILSSPFPVWIRCRGCGAKLVGNWLVKLLGLLVVPLGALVGWLSFRVATHVVNPPLALVVLAILVIAVMTYITLRWGRYRMRSPK